MASKSKQGISARVAAERAKPATAKPPTGEDVAAALADPETLASVERVFVQGGHRVASAIGSHVGVAFSVATLAAAQPPPSSCEGGELAKWAQRIARQALALNDGLTVEIEAQNHARMEQVRAAYDEANPSPEHEAELPEEEA